MNAEAGVGVGERGNGAVAGGGDSDLRSPGLRLDCKSMTPGREAGGGGSENPKGRAPPLFLPVKSKS